MDEKGEEFSGGHCWLPDDIKQVIKTIREAFHLRIILEKGALIFFIEHADDDFIKPMKQEHIRLFQKTKKTYKSGTRRHKRHNTGQIIVNKIIIMSILNQYIK